MADRYDGYILDLWGVIHDGVRAYPGVPQCLAALKAAGKQTCLLSNAPRRIVAVKNKLEEVGVPRGSYDFLMTSGEATHLYLGDGTDRTHRHLGRRFLHIGPPRDDDIHQGLDLSEVGTPAQADFVLCTGIDDFDETLDDYRHVLDACLDEELPLICANPDLVVMVGSKMAICAGTLAHYYETKGGRVIYHGKPYPGVYDVCAGLLIDVPKHRQLAIGDSLRTDIAGAHAAGVDSLWVLGGIHAEETLKDGEPVEDAIAGILSSATHWPNGILRGLTW